MSLGPTFFRLSDGRWGKGSVLLSDGYLVFDEDDPDELVIRCDRVPDRADVPNHARKMLADAGIEVEPISDDIAIRRSGRYGFDGGNRLGTMHEAWSIWVKLAAPVPVGLMNGQGIRLKLPPDCTSIDPKPKKARS